MHGGFGAAAQVSFTEALVAGLPAVTYLPIAGHGRANATVLAPASLAPWARDPAELVTAIDDIINRPRLVVTPPRSTDASDASDAVAVVTALIADRMASGPELPECASA